MLDVVDKLGILKPARHAPACRSWPPIRLIFSGEPVSEAERSFIRKYRRRISEPAQQNRQRPEQSVLGSAMLGR
jgi:hypothetical protein